MVDLLTELKDAHRESPSWRLFGLCHQAADRIAALEAKLAERVKVKPLEWLEEISETWWTAESYRIETFDGGGFAARVAHSQSRSFRTIAHGVTFETAKAAAQTDHERRILSALEATPPAPKVTEAMVEAGCKAFLAEYGDPSAEWHHYRREVTAALIAAMESGQ